MIKMKFLIIQKTVIRKENKESYQVFLEENHERKLVKSLVAFRQIEDALKELYKPDMKISFFDCSFESEEDLKEHLERFI